MKNEPLTLVIALNAENKAKGMIYFDDGESFDYQNGNYSLVEISYNNRNIEFNWIKYNYNYVKNIEKIIIIGEKEEIFYQQKLSALLFMKNNITKNLEVNKFVDIKMIEIIRMNKYNLYEIQSIQIK